MNLIRDQPTKIKNYKLFKRKSRGLKNTRICFKMTDESSKSSDTQGCTGNTDIEIKVYAKKCKLEEI